MSTDLISALLCAIRNNTQTSRWGRVVGDCAAYGCSQQAGPSMAILPFHCTQSKIHDSFRGRLFKTSPIHGRLLGFSRPRFEFGVRNSLIFNRAVTIWD